MLRFMTCVGVLLLAGVLASCGGGGGGDSPSTPATTTGGTPPNNGGTPPNNTPPNNTPPNNTPPAVSKPGRFEETDATVTFSPGDWGPTDAKFGWSGGNAKRSTVPNATVSFTFSGTWVTWIGARNGDGGIAEVSVDGGPARQVDLFIRAQEMRTPVVTLHDLSPGQHTLTIRVTGDRNPDSTSTELPVVVVDAFDVEAPILSHLQDRDRGAVYKGTWAISSQTTYDPPRDPTPATDPIDHSANWSGGGVESAPEGPHGGASFTTTVGDSVELTFRGTSITWQGGHGPDGGFANVQVDGGPATPVDTYGPTQKFQEIMFSKTGLANGQHTLTITVAAEKNPASAGNKIFVDAFDVTTPGRRFQEDDINPSTGLPATTYAGKWTRNINRVWSEGAVQRADAAGSTATFTFTGTGVSYIGCQKNSIGPVRIKLDDVDMGQIDNFLPSPVEAYNFPIFHIDGLKPGPHKLVVESVSSTAFIVVDAFDVRP